MDKYTLKMIMFYLWINFNNVATDLEIRDTTKEQLFY